MAKLEDIQEIKRDKYLRNKYGISLNEYNLIFIQQNGGCAICEGKPKPGKNLNVDHNHQSGAVRGLLCYRCNRYLVGPLEKRFKFPRVALMMLNRYCTKYSLKGDEEFLAEHGRHRRTK